MEPFISITAVVAPLRIVNIDTDMIIPKQFLKTIQRTGLGQYAFHEKRTLSDGSKNPDFILNQAPFDKAKILLAGKNFGCGSSREHAPWALKDFGFRVIIAESFADIFYNNCFENGILPAIVPSSESISALENYIHTSQDKKISIDLEMKKINFGNDVLSFNIDDFRQERLLKGVDSIGLTLTKEALITDFEEKRKLSKAWL